MSAARSLASRLLAAVANLSPPRSRPWADAMLRELDFVEGDLGALRWALGGAAALFRHSVPQLWQLALEKRVPVVDVTVRDLGTKTTGVVSGVVYAGALLLACVGGLARLAAVVSMSWGVGRIPLLECSIAFALPEMAFMAAAVALWRKHRSVAAGILLSGVTLVAHLIVHFSKYGWLN